MAICQVSVCLPTFNAIQFLPERLASLKSQLCVQWELIVCDSYSDDGTWEYLQQFEDDSRVRLYQVPREGLYAGWNECLKRARGEYIYIATADDTMVQECLGRMVGTLEKAKNVESGQWTVGSNLDGPDYSRSTFHIPQSTPDRPRPVDLCVCRYDRINENGEVLPQRQSGIDEFFGEWGDQPHVRSGLTEFLTMMCLECHWDSVTAMLFRRELLDRCGLFRTDCGTSADRVWRWRAVLSSDVAYVPDRLATWRVHSKQATARTRADTDHARRVHRLADDTVDECGAFIPDSWKSDLQWREKLRQHFWAEYLSGYGLDRTTLRSTPGNFAKGVVRSLVREPGYLMRRLGNGLSWNDPLFEDEVVRLKCLINEWDVPWPPVPLDL